jgi:hypothetical protein
MLIMKEINGVPGLYRRDCLQIARHYGHYKRIQLESSDFEQQNGCFSINQNTYI